MSNASNGAVAESSLRRSLRLVVAGGSLAMVYSTGVTSPATTEFFRAIGASEFHFGLITGLPMVMLLLQFAGAWYGNLARRRKPCFMWLLILCRLVYLPIAFLPLVLAGSPGRAVGVSVALMAVSAGLQNFATPLWFSWMADLIPPALLNRFWAWRQRSMHLTWTASYLLVTLFLYAVRRPPTFQFPLLVVAALVAGVADILLFLRVDEPPNSVVQRPLAGALAEPWRHRHYRRFLVFQCCWTFATNFAAPFLQLYVLKMLGVPVWLTALVWCLAGVGTAMAARMWGRAADRHGQRPILNICTTLKPAIMVAFLFASRDNVLWLLAPVMFFDGALNSGNMVAANGFMLKLAPRHNRGMFVAAITGLAGLCGGLSAILGGLFLGRGEHLAVEAFGRTWNRYHLLFALSFVLRLAVIPLARRVREPASTGSRQVLAEILGPFPMTVLRSPLLVYRRLRSFGREDGAG
jgi:MFS family permease